MFSIPCINNISTLMAYPLGFFYQFSLFVIFPRKRLQRHCRTAAQSKFLISVSYVFSQCDTDSYCEHTADGVYMQFSSFVSVCWSLCVLSLSLCVCVSLCVCLFVISNYGTSIKRIIFVKPSLKLTPLSINNTARHKVLRLSKCRT